MKLKNDNPKTSPTIALSLIYFSQFVLFWGDGCRAIEADHILYCISIEPLLMDEQDDGKQKCKRPHPSDDVIMTWVVRIVWSQHGFHFICKMRLIWKEIQISISNQLCNSNIIDHVSVQRVNLYWGSQSETSTFCWEDVNRRRSRMGKSKHLTLSETLWGSHGLGWVANSNRLLGEREWQILTPTGPFYPSHSFWVKSKLFSYWQMDQ